MCVIVGVYSVVKEGERWRRHSDRGLTLYASDIHSMERARCCLKYDSQPTILPRRYIIYIFPWFIHSWKYESRPALGIRRHTQTHTYIYIYTQVYTLGHQFIKEGGAFVRKFTAGPSTVLLTRGPQYCYYLLLLLGFNKTKERTFRCYSRWVYFMEGNYAKYLPSSLHLISFFFFCFSNF